MKAILLAVLVALAGAPKKGKKPPTPTPTQTPAPTQQKPADKVKTFDFTAMGIEGRVLTPQLLYLLGRIRVELDRVELEKRSFLPEVVRSVDEGGF